MGNCVSTPRSSKKSKQDPQLAVTKNSKKASENSTYFLAKPTEFSEIERLNMQHYILKVVFNGMHISEVDYLKDGGEVLDVCSGSGIWSIEMAKKFPKANFTGMDISPVTNDNLPPNVKFITANATHRFPFPDNHFDFVHMRLVLYVFKQAEWVPVLKEFHRVLKKGRYFQICETAPDVGSVGECGIFTSKLQNTMAARGQDPKVTDNIPSYLQAAHFKDLKSDYRSIPYGWGNRIGEVMLEDYLAASRGARSNLSKIFGLTPEQYDEHIERVSQTMINEKQYGNWWNFWGIKEDDVVDDDPTATTYNGTVEITTLGGDGTESRLEWMESNPTKEFDTMIGSKGRRNSEILEEVEEESQHNDDK